MKIFIKTASAAMFFAVLNGCATVNWGEFDGQRARLADPDAYDVIVLAVDGRATFDARTLQRLEPGFHLLQVASAKTNAQGEVSGKSLPIVVKPCMRYGFFAKHRSRMNISDWDLVPIGEEQMPGCTTKGS